jgi:integrase
MEGPDRVPAREWRHLRLREQMGQPAIVEADTEEVSLPIHPDLSRILENAPPHAAATLAAASTGTTWTVSGFNATFIKAIRRLEKQGKIEAGLTFHGLRHTCGTTLVEAGFDIDSVRRWLGQKTLAMAIHYTKTADTSQRLKQMMKKFDPLGSKQRTKVSNFSRKVSNRKRQHKLSD